MNNPRFSRRYFFYGTLLAGAVPTGGFGSTTSLSRLGYKSPNEKLNIAAIGSGGAFAKSAAVALLENTNLGAREIVEKSMRIAADVCIYTNENVTYEELA